MKKFIVKKFLTLSSPLMLSAGFIFSANHKVLIIVN